ncbi:MAG TPA: hypothetical protein VII73_06415 [Caulobacteraceae bacterium]
MLAKATRWLASRSARTLIVARRATLFIAGQTGMVAVNADWNAAKFPATLQRAIAEAPAIGTALIWLHDPEPALAWLLPVLPGARVVLVLGSVSEAPTLPTSAARIATVRLGSIATAHGRRWLSDDEISDGAIAALRDGRSRIVGELGPVG